MADVLHRTTKELRRSVNTPDYDPAQWILRPDLAAVADVPPQYWQIEGDAVRPMTAEEQGAVDAAATTAARQQARTEALALVQNASGLRTVLQAISIVTQVEIRALKRGTPRPEATLDQLKTELTQLIESGAAD